MTQMKNLSIRKGLQIILTDGFRFICPGRDLESVEAEVREWASTHPTHQRIDEVQQWLTSAEARLSEISDIQNSRAIQTRETAIAEKAREIRPGIRKQLWNEKCPFKDLDLKADEIAERRAREILGYK